MLRRSIFFGLFLFIIAGLFQTAAAQGRFRMTTEERVAMLKDSLSLNADQVKKITVILNDADKQRQEIFNSSDDRDGMREKMMKIMEDTDTKIKKELNKTQTKKYDEMQERRRERMRQFRG